MVSHTHTRSIGAGRVGETCSALSSHLTHDGEAAEADARFFFLSHGVDTETCERGEGTKIDEMRRRSDLEMVCDIKYLPPPRGWHEKISDALLEPRSGGTPDGWPWGLRRDARSLRKETSGTPPFTTMYAYAHATGAFPFTSRTGVSGGGLGGPRRGG